VRAYLPLFLLLVVLAVLLRDDAVLTLFYLLIAVFVVGAWWSERALRAVTARRVFADHTFPGETVRVRVAVANSGWLPVVWLRLRESVPVDLSGRRTPQDVVSLGPRGHAELEYTVQAHKRGYYPLGPLFLTSGDLLGLNDEQQREAAVDYLTVYPEVVPLTRLALPSRSPLGTLRHPLPIFEDPTRPVGKRDYVSGDSLRRLDWKATAAVGRLQVKQFEPSIALATMLIVDLAYDGYDLRSRYDASELAIVVAASIANWVTGQKQAVGLVTNGADPLGGGDRHATPARKGRLHLMRLLETLARIQLAAHAQPLAELLRRESTLLPWGTTAVVVTGLVDEAVVAALLQARHAGLNVVLVVAGPAPGVDALRRRLARFGVAVYAVAQRRDLDQWRG